MPESAESEVVQDAPMTPKTVWTVWTEEGEYEQWSRDLRGMFASPEAAQEHAAQLRATGSYDVCEVVDEDILDAVPSQVPHIRWSAHVTPAGHEDRICGFDRGEQYKTWSNEITAAEGTLGPWGRPDEPDLYIEVVGCDVDAVRVEYERLLALARE